MKKKDYVELTAALNNFKTKAGNKSFTRSDLLEELIKIGFNKQIANALLAKIPCEKIGTSKLYYFSKEPIYKGLIESLYRKAATYKQVHREKKAIAETTASTEQDALNTLSKLGYRIQKCIGFDLERFKKENPILYRRYLKYEEV